MTTSEVDVTAQLVTMLRSGVEISSTVDLLRALIEASDDGTIAAISKATLSKLKKSTRREEEHTAVYECATSGCGLQFATLKRLRAHVKTEKHFADLKAVKLQYYKILKDSIVESFKADDNHIETAKETFNEIVDILDEMHPQRGVRGEGRTTRSDLEMRMKDAAGRLFHTFVEASREFCELNDINQLLRTLPRNLDDADDQHEPALTLIEVETNRLKFMRRVAILERLFSHN